MSLGVGSAQGLRGALEALDQYSRQFPIISSRIYLAAEMLMMDKHVEEWINRVVRVMCVQVT